MQQPKSTVCVSVVRALCRQMDRENFPSTLLQWQSVLDGFVDILYETANLKLTKRIRNVYIFRFKLYRSNTQDMHAHTYNRIQYRCQANAHL